MNLDVSPDGRTIAFDLLGDIYTMPIAGGRADPDLARASPYEMQPRFSPDGSQIAFTSDRGGGDNIWVMNADGSDKRQLTKETFTLLNNPTWSADGQYHRRAQAFHHPALARHRRDLALPCRRRRRRRPGRAAQSAVPEGTGRAGLHPRRRRASISAATPRRATISNTRRIRTSRCSRSSATTSQTGERRTIAGGPGGAVRPTPSPDGR